MSYIRPEIKLVGACPTCKRDGYETKKYRNLRTGGEFTKLHGGLIPRIKGVPDFYEMMYAGCGASIYQAIEEAKEYCVDYGVPGVAFEFNGEPVLVTGLSNVDKVYRAWWHKVYKETPEESFARR